MTHRGSSIKTPSMFSYILASLLFVTIIGTFVSRFAPSLMCEGRRLVLGSEASKTSGNKLLDSLISDARMDGVPIDYKVSVVSSDEMARLVRGSGAPLLCDLVPSSVAAMAGSLNPCAGNMAAYSSSNIGMCFISALGERSIAIDQSVLFPPVSRIEITKLLAHEIGHCSYFYLQHSLDPNSLMFETVDFVSPREKNWSVRQFVQSLTSNEFIPSFRSTKADRTKR